MAIIDRPQFPAGCVATHQMRSAYKKEKGHHDAPYFVSWGDF